MTIDAHESPCSYCGTLTVDVALSDLSDLGPRLHSVCEVCADEIMAEFHEGDCDCDVCRRRRFEAFCEDKRREADVIRSGVYEMAWLLGLSEEDLT